MAAAEEPAAAKNVYRNMQHKNKAMIGHFIMDLSRLVERNETLTKDHFESFIAKVKNYRNDEIMRILFSKTLDEADKEALKERINRISDTIHSSDCGGGGGGGGDPADIEIKKYSVGFQQFIEYAKIGIYYLCEEKDIRKGQAGARTVVTQYLQPQAVGMGGGTRRKKLKRRKTQRRSIK